MGDYAGMPLSRSVATPCLHNTEAYNNSSSDMHPVFVSSKTAFLTRVVYYQLLFCSYPCAAEHILELVDLTGCSGSDQSFLHV